MLTKVKKWGNSQGLRLPKTILEEVQLHVGDEVNVAVKNRKIIIEAVNNVRGAYNLKELVSKIPEDYGNKEVDWGFPVGKEEW